MSVRLLARLLLYLQLALVAGQVGPFSLSAGSSSGQGNSHGGKNDKKPKLVPLPDPPSKPATAKTEREHSVVWREARHSGAKLSASLQKTHAQAAPKLDKELQMGYYHVTRPQGQFILWTPFSEIPKVGLYRRVAVHATRSPLNFINQAPYVNTFDPARGIIGVEWDFKQLDSTPEADRLHLSDLLYASYQNLVQAREKGRSVPPRYVVVTWVVTPETKTVLDEAHAGRKSVERVWRPGTAEYEAMLGTTQGKIVMHMLIDFCKWSRCRMPSAVKTAFAYPPQGPAAWFMLFELRGKDAQGKLTKSIDDEGDVRKQ